MELNFWSLHRSLESERKISMLHLSHLVMAKSVIKPKAPQCTVDAGQSILSSERYSAYDLRQDFEGYTFKLNVQNLHCANIYT